MTKTLCKFRRIEIADKFSTITSIISQPKYVCSSCARSANDKAYLCKPSALGKPVKNKCVNNSTPVAVTTSNIAPVLTQTLPVTNAISQTTVHSLPALSMGAQAQLQAMVIIEQEQAKPDVVFTNKQAKKLKKLAKKKNKQLKQAAKAVKQYNKALKKAKKALNL
ncbi:hypothetical protein C9J12_18385 [Photobacterium frigidiphilum]|uniref:Uncharacterized protein n=1 Tax=Photobacterium frigidiphilum TaxID=264736 RepID=A0A2T3JC50_9GAMM|nr:hypothetical protein [Photobacterium frigidiphilum]PSU46446.1 hypothetical protein C9J12_18385 [Photobacterium frigidiphilum]